MAQRVYYNRKEFLPKHRELYIMYGILLKHFKDDTQNMNLKEFYEIIADYFYIDQTMVGRVVRKMQKMRYIPNQCEIDEFTSKINSLGIYINGSDNTRK